MRSDDIPMRVPDRYQAELLAGTVYRVGTLLFRKDQPGVLAHLVEAGGLAPAIGAMAANPALGTATMLVRTGAQIATVVQNQQIKAAIATLGTLQLGTMALSGVGIGVSIVSTAILSRKIDRMGEQVAALDDKLERIARLIDDLKAEVIAEDFDRLRTACERVDEAWRIADPEPQWRAAADELHHLQNRFARRACRIIGETDEASAIEPFIDALALTGSARISSRLAAGDTDLADHAAQVFARELGAITEPVGTARLLAGELGGIHPGDTRYAAEVERLRPAAEAAAAAFREREAIAGSTPATIQRLRQLDVSGRALLERARAETDQPVLMIDGEAAEPA